MKSCKGSRAVREQITNAFFPYHFTLATKEQVHKNDKYPLKRARLSFFAKKTPIKHTKNSSKVKKERNDRIITYINQHIRMQTKIYAHHGKTSGIRNMFEHVAEILEGIYTISTINVDNTAIPSS